MKTQITYHINRTKLMENNQLDAKEKNHILQAEAFNWLCSKESPMTQSRNVVLIIPKLLAGAP